jgi:hypothetical protein
MEKKYWILLLIIITITISWYNTIEGFGEPEGGFTHINATSTGQISKGKNIQQPIGENADKLYLMIFAIIVLFICVVGYFIYYAMTGTSSNDVKINASNNWLLQAVATGYTAIIQHFGNFFSSMGNFLLFLFIIFIVFVIPIYTVAENASNGSINKSKLNMINLFLIIVFIIGIPFIKKINQNDFFKNTTFSLDASEPMGVFICVLLTLVFILLIINGGGMFNNGEGEPISLTVGLLSLLVIFILFNVFYSGLVKLLLKLVAAFSTSILVAVLIIFLIFGITYFNSPSDGKGPYGDNYRNKLTGSVLLSLFFLYILAFFAHYIYFHGFLWVDNIPFLKYFNLPIMYSSKLKKSPLYVFCEGILFEPFYKWYSEDRRIIKDWHRIFFKDGPKINFV